MLPVPDPIGRAPIQAAGIDRPAFRPASGSLGFLPAIDMLVARRSGLRGATAGLARIPGVLLPAPAPSLAAPRLMRPPDQAGAMWSTGPCTVLAPTLAIRFVIATCSGRYRPDEPHRRGYLEAG